MTREDIVETARDYVTRGVPWRHMGRSENDVDCVGLLIMIAKKLRIDYQDYPENYRREPERKKLETFLQSQLIRKRPPLKHGMVVLVREEVYPCHVGIYATDRGHPTFIHACANRHKVIEDAYHLWSGKFYMALDFPGLDN